MSKTLPLKPFYIEKRNTSTKDWTDFVRTSKFQKIILPTFSKKKKDKLAKRTILRSCISEVDEKQ